MNRFIKLISFLAAGLFLIIHSSCRTDCSDQDFNLGHIEHNQLTLDFIHYSDGETITFRNLDGEQEIFTVFEDPDINPKLCVEVTCRPTFQYDGENACDYYSADGNYFVLMGDDHFLHFRTGIESFQPESELFYEYVDVGVSGDFTTGFAGIITTNNFSSTSLSAFNTVLENDLIFQDSTVIGSLINVYAYANEETDIYLLLDKEKGIVEYKFEGQIWQLVE